MCQVIVEDGSEKGQKNRSYSSRFQEAADKVKQIPVQL